MAGSWDRCRGRIHSGGARLRALADAAWRPDVQGDALRRCNPSEVNKDGAAPPTWSAEASRSAVVSEDSITAGRRATTAAASGLDQRWTNSPASTPPSPRMAAVARMAAELATFVSVGDMEGARLVSTRRSASSSREVSTSSAWARSLWLVASARRRCAEDIAAAAERLREVLRLCVRTAELCLRHGARPRGPDPLHGVRSGIQGSSGSRIRASFHAVGGDWERAAPRLNSTCRTGHKELDNCETVCPSSVRRSSVGRARAALGGRRARLSDRTAPCSGAREASIRVARPCAAC
jgi:hypothetical protein